MSENIKYYLGVDGGGTKTRFALADNCGRILKVVTLGASNPIDLGISACLDVLSEGIEKVCEGIPFSQISAFVGVAGGISGGNAELISKFLAEYSFAKYANGSDSENILAAGLKGKDGVAVIMGTGSCAFVRKGGRTIRIGGMGYLFDFAGSGYDVGAHGIAAALGEEDGTGEKTKIRDKILARTGKSSVLDSLGEFYAKGKREIASYAPTVFEAFDEGDEVARRILRTNMKRVALLIRTAGKRFDEEIVNVKVVGGLAKRFDVLKPYIEEELSNLNDDKKYVFEVLNEDVVNGALYRAGLSQEVKIC